MAMLECRSVILSEDLAKIKLRRNIHCTQLTFILSTRAGVPMQRLDRQVLFYTDQ